MCRPVKLLHYLNVCAMCGPLNLIRAEFVSCYVKVKVWLVLLSSAIEIVFNVNATPSRKQMLIVYLHGKASAHC